MSNSVKQELPKPWVETPLVESKTLSQAAGCRIFLKFENLQPSGSFKSRGIGNVIRSVLSSPPYSLSPLSAIPSSLGKPTATTTHAFPTTPPDTNVSTPSPPHFYCSSGGNAGLACVTAAVSLSCPATVVVPTITSPLMISRIKAAGAHTVLAHGASWKEADTYLREEVLPQDEQGVYVPPFDDERVWDGNATLVEELRKQMKGVGQPDAVICSVGGGGLFVGVAKGLERASCSNNSSSSSSSTTNADIGADDAGLPAWEPGKTKIIATETRGADSLNASLRAGSLITLDSITSIAISLGARRVAPQAFTYAHENPHIVKSLVLSDREAARACVRFADDERVMVEPACGVNVAVVYDEGLLRGCLEGLGVWRGRETRVVVVVCGGSHVTVGKLVEWQKEFGG